MTIPLLPSLDRTSLTFREEVDLFFGTQLPATIPAFNAEMERVNQFAFGSYSAASTTSLTVGTGSKSLTVETGKSFTAGQFILLVNSSAPSNYMNGQLVSYTPSTGTMEVSVTSVSGGGTASTWNVSVSATVIVPVATITQRNITVTDTIVTGDIGKLLNLNGTFVLNVTAAATLGNGWWCWLRNNGTGTVTLDPNASEIVNGVSTIDLTDTVQLICDGTTFTAIYYAENRIGDVVVGSRKPAGSWLELNGAVYLQSSYTALYSQLGILANAPEEVSPLTASSLPASATWQSVAYGNGVFVAISSGSNSAATSPAGVTWTARTLPSSSGWTSVTYGNGLFVAVSGTTGTIAASSPDGITWTARTLPASTNWQNVTYGNGLFLAIAVGTATAATSPDGITWTARTLPSSSLWSNAAYGNGKFVVIASGSTDVAISADGITWTSGTLPSSGWRGLTYGNGLFVTVRDSFATAATSPDGSNWTLRTLPSNSQWKDVAFGAGVFLVVGNASTAAAASSVDGITWTARTLPSSSLWQSVVYGAGKFVAVSSTTGTSALYSGLIATYNISTQFYVPRIYQAPGISYWIKAK